jgi:SAM-dependent methyltransferase
VITNTAAKQRWLAAVWPFVHAHLPPAPCRVLEIGCGPTGGFIPALRTHGYDVIGVDPAAPHGPDYRQIEFEHYGGTDPVDAIVACTSLHHVADHDGVLDRIASTLAPGGTLIVMEWAQEKFDEATARWCFDRLPDMDEPGWLRRHRDQWHASRAPWRAYLDAWAQREGLHSGQDIVHGLETRLHTRLLAHTPYFYTDLDRVTEADEQAAIDTGQIQATGIRYVATTPGTPHAAERARGE